MIFKIFFLVQLIIINITLCNIILYSNGTQEIKSYYDKELILPGNTNINGYNIINEINELKNKINLIESKLNECNSNGLTYCKCFYFNSDIYGNLHDIKILISETCDSNILKNFIVLEINDRTSYFENPCTNYTHQLCNFTN